MIRPRLVLLVVIALVLAAAVVIEGIPPDFGDPQRSPGNGDQQSPQSMDEFGSGTDYPDYPDREDYVEDAAPAMAVAGLSPPFKDKMTATRQTLPLARALGDAVPGDALVIWDIYIEDPESPINCIRAPCDPVTRFAIGTAPLPRQEAEELCAYLREDGHYCHVADAAILQKEPPDNYISWPTALVEVDG